jgi:hypothetical protein
VKKSPSLAIIAALMFAWFGRSAAAWDQPSGAQVIQEGSGCDYYGSDYYTASVSSVDECGSRCLGDSYCTSYSYNASSHVCNFKHATPPQRSQSSQWECGFVTPRYEWQVDRPTDSDLADYFPTQVATIEQCKAKCDANPDCGAWTFDTSAVQGVNAAAANDDRSCWTHRGTPAPVSHTDATASCNDGYWYSCVARGQTNQKCWQCTSFAHGYLVSGLRD